MSGRPLVDIFVCHTWMQYLLGEETAPMFYRFGVALFNIEEGLDTRESAQKTIDAVGDSLQ